MKKDSFVIPLAILLLLLLCQGCSNTYLEDSPTFKSSEATSMKSNTSANIITRTNLYEITETEGLYYYALFDKTGNIVKSESNLTRQPKIICIENNVVRITIQAGTGIETQWGFYYDQENNTISAIYQCIFDEKNGIVAHATMDKIIVESIFKNDDFYYKEINTFQKPFSDVAFPFVDAEFSENGNIIYVSYHSGSDYEETTEAFTLAN